MTAQRRPDIIPFRRPPEPGDEITIAQVVQLYLDYAARKLAPRTLENRVRYLRMLEDDLGHKTIGESRRSDLETWLHTNNQHWASDWTKRTVVGIVQTAFNWAVGDERIGRNPFKGFAWREGEGRRPTTEEEFARMLRESSSLFRRVLLFSAETGARPGEMSALTWPQIDFDGRKATLIKHKTRSRQKKPKPRIIRLSAVALGLLRWLHARRKDDGLVFRNSRGGAWTGQSLHKRIDRIREKVGLAKDVVLYGLRHKFGTDCAEAGYNTSTTAELMGHDDPRTTERYYIHLSERERHLRESVDGLKNVRKRNRKQAEE